MFCLKPSRQFVIRRRGAGSNWYLTLCFSLFSEMENERKFKCQNCDKKFSSRQGRHRHQKTCGTERRTIECQTCQKRFTDARGLSQHRKTCAVPKIPKAACDMCQGTSVFESQEELQQHIRQAHQADCFCPHCQTRVRNQAALETHLRVCVVRSDSAAGLERGEPPARKVVIRGEHVPRPESAGSQSSRSLTPEPESEEVVSRIGQVSRPVSTDSQSPSSLAPESESESWLTEEALCSISEGLDDSSGEDCGDVEFRDEGPCSVSAREKVLSLELAGGLPSHSPSKLLATSEKPTEESAAQGSGGSVSAAGEGRDDCQELGDLACQVMRLAKAAGQQRLLAEFKEYLLGWKDRLEGKADTAEGSTGASQAVGDSPQTSPSVSAEAAVGSEPAEPAGKWLALGPEGLTDMRPVTRFPTGSSERGQSQVCQDQTGSDCLAQISDPHTAWKTLAAQDGFWRWVEHPAHLFHGAPSDAAKHQQLTMLQLVKQRARTGVGYQGVTLEETGIRTLRRTEKAVFRADPKDEDSLTTYELSTDWLSTPGPKITTQAATQVPEYFSISESF